MNTEPDAYATVKVLIAWIGAMVGGISLSNLVLIATLIYTLLQIYLLVRKTWFPRNGKRQ